jgi:translation initiation factor IF-3
MNGKHRINEQIRTTPVRVVSQGGELLDAMPTTEAIELARKAGLDLVEIAPEEHPALCRIMDYGKFRRDRKAASLINLLFRRPQ